MGIFGKFFGKNPSKDEFARTLADAIRKAGEKAPVLYEAGEFRLVADRDGNPHILNLGNLYAEYCSAPREKRAEVLRRYTRTWFSYRQGVPDDFADVHPDLLPSVRNRSYFELTKLELQAQGMPAPDWPYQPIAGDLAVGLVYDLPDSIVMLQADRLTTWGVGFDEALATARQNLAGMSPGPLESAGSGVWVSPWRDNHDAARLLLTDMIRSHPVKGDPVAIIPNRDSLLLSGTGDERGLARIAELAEKGRDHPRSYPPFPLRLDGETWVPYLPPENHTQRAAFELLRTQAAGSDYADQAEVLKRLHAKTGEDVFIAAFSAIRNSTTGAVTSYCVWSERVHGLLPRTDLIFFFRPKGEGGDVIARANWDRVQEVCGDLLTPLDLYPERYLVSGTFPSEAQLCELAAGG